MVEKLVLPLHAIGSPDCILNLSQEVGRLGDQEGGKRETQDVAVIGSTGSRALWL